MTRFMTVCCIVLALCTCLSFSVQAQTFSWGDNWVNGQAGAAFGHWQLGYHSGSNPNYTLKPLDDRSW